MGLVSVSLTLIKILCICQDEFVLEIILTSAQASSHSARRLGYPPEVGASAPRWLEQTPDYNRSLMC